MSARCRPLPQFSGGPARCLAPDMAGARAVARETFEDAVRKESQARLYAENEHTFLVRTLRPVRSRDK